MSSKSDKEKLKQIQDKCQTVLSQLLRDEDNKYCVDCDAKGPRWASWNLGIFLCIRCAGIHRNLGVHISKVKSVNLDSWNPEQVTCLQQMGNSRARAVFEANLPDNFRRPQTDSALEAFIRAKYEQKRYIAKEWVPPPMPKPSFEFEEEKKKTKERKPAKPGGYEVPLPLNSAPRKNGNLSSIINSDSKYNEIKGKSSGTADLLGLNEPPATTTSSDDPFGGFLSADTSVDVTAAHSPQTAHSNDAERSKTLNNQSISDHESLFSQLGGDDLQKKQQPLSKESILSLYGQTPVQQQAQQPQIIGISGPMYASQQQIPMFGISGIPIPPSGYPILPGIGNSIIGVPGAPMMAQVTQTNLMGTNPFLNPGSCGAIGGWYSATNPTQPTFGQLNQQMSTLSMGSQGLGGMVQPLQNPAGLSWAGQQPGQTLSNNLWQ